MPDADRTRMSKPRVGLVLVKGSDDELHFLMELRNCNLTYYKDQRPLTWEWQRD